MFCLFVFLEQLCRGVVGRWGQRQKAEREGRGENRRQRGKEGVRTGGREGRKG